MSSFSDPEVSVILPCYNVETTIKTAVQSILDQTLENIELIVIDNNSDDKTLKVLMEMAKLDIRIKIFRETEQGVAHAFNHGLMHTNANFIARMDADDIAHPSRLMDQLNYLKNNPKVQICATQAEYEGVTTSDFKEGFASYVEWSNQLISFSDISLNRFVENPIITPSLMFRKKIFETYDSYQDGAFPEDYERALFWLSKDVIIHKLDKALLKWRDSNNRLTRTSSAYSRKSFDHCKIKYLAIWLKSKGKSAVWIWGAGKLGKKRAKMLHSYGIQIVGFIDVIKRSKNAVCILYSEIRDIKPLDPFIVSFVSNRNIRDEIRIYLLSEGFIEGSNFILAS